MNLTPVNRFPSLGLPIQPSGKLWKDSLLTEVLTEVMIRRSMQKTLHTLVMSNL